MVSTVQALNSFQQLASVRLVAASNQSGQYYNGPLNSGVGATFTYATGALTIDSVVVRVGDFVLLASQTNGYENGIYTCIQAGATGVAAILQRRGDFQCLEQINAGYFIPVSAGTTYGGSIWTVIEPLPFGMGVPVTTGDNDINLATITASGSSLFLERASNLSDLTNAGTAVTNLGFSQAAAKYLYSALAIPDQNTNLVKFDVACSALILAAGGSVDLYASTSTKQYKIRALWINSGGTNFSGGGGNRLGQITDNTTVYSVIPAVNLQTLTNNGWGSTPLPYPASAAINTNTAAGASLVFKYSGGTTDYDNGIITISGLLERVA